MPAEGQLLRVAIAGASSLSGKELMQVLEDSRFAGAEVRLLDEDIAAGTLTEAGGEPTLIHVVDENSFERIQFVFFTGSPAFTMRHWENARRAGATVIDLSGGLAEVPSSVRWIPSLEAVLSPPAPGGGQMGRQLFLSPPAPAIVACSLAAALTGFAIERMMMVFFQPVSERGQAGIEELESQTIKLLSFQTIAQDVFDAQVAFNLLDRYGAASDASLAEIRARIACEVRDYLAGRVTLPAIQLIQAPVFYSYAFTASAELGAPPGREELECALHTTGIRLASTEEPAPNNVSVAGEARIMLGQMERDPNVERGYWFWGAADSLRLVAANAVSIAERLLAS